LNLAENILSEESERYQQWLISPNATPIALQGATKSELARHLVEALEELLFQDRPGSSRTSSHSEPNLNV
jgi:hypothetical protein